MKQPGRMGWLDAARVMAAVGVVLIHGTANYDGNPFHVPSGAQNFAAALLRNVAELSGAEIFIVLSLFLLAFRLERKEIPWLTLLRGHARRLLVPFAIWSLFFAFFRLVKASEFNYAKAIWAELHSVQAWIRYALLGSAQYHLHFLPTLFCVLLFYPAMRLARRQPALGLLVVPFLYSMDQVQRWAWGYFTDPFARTLFVGAVHDLGFLGYGMAGFALFGLWKRGATRETSRQLLAMSLTVAALAFAITVAAGASVAQTGKWGDRTGAFFFAHYLMPILVFAVFMGAEHRAWSAAWGRFAQYSFGVYLVHPIFVDGFEVAVHHLGWQLAPVVMILTKFAFAAPLAFALAVAISRTPLAWVIGLDQAAPRLPASPRVAASGPQGPAPLPGVS